MLKRIITIALAFVMCLGVAMPAWAAEEAKHFSQKVMPSEIIAALTVQKSFDGSSILGMKNIVNVQNELLSNIALPTSLDIEIINIDMDKVHQTYPLTEDQMEQLKMHGYTDDEIASLDMGDFFNIEGSWVIDPSIISYIKFLYPELVDIDISKWTNADWIEYYKKEDAKKYAPTDKEAQALEERNIALYDAQNLLKDYYSYENILAQSDEQLAKDIEAYYQFTLDNIREMAKYEKKENNKYKIYPPTNPNSNYYIKVDFPGYQEDWFHKTLDQVMLLIERNKLLPHKLHTIVYIIHDPRILQQICMEHGLLKVQERMRD